MVLLEILTVLLVTSYAVNAESNVEDLKKYVDSNLLSIRSDIKMLNKTLLFHHHKSKSGNDVTKALEEIRFNLSTLGMDIRQLFFGRKFLKKSIQRSIKTNKHTMENEMHRVQKSIANIATDIGDLSLRVDAIQDGVERGGLSVPVVTTTSSTQSDTRYTVAPPTEQMILVRLRGGGPDRHARRKKPHKGRVEMLYKGEWGTICDDSWGDMDAKVICKMLGYMRGGRAVGEASFGRGTGRIWLDDVGCTGMENHIMQCSKYFEHSCSHDEDAGVECYEDFPLVEDVRLVGGRTPSEGRVEINRNGGWGTICGDMWDDRDANVVCWMLKYDFGFANKSGTFGPGTGEIWMDDVLCHGNEENVYECGHRGWRLHNCSHDNDAGVTCGNWNGRDKDSGHYYSDTVLETMRRGDIPP